MAVRALYLGAQAHQPGRSSWVFHALPVISGATTSCGVTESFYLGIPGSSHTTFLPDGGAASGGVGEGSEEEGGEGEGSENRLGKGTTDKHDQPGVGGRLKTNGMTALEAAIWCVHRPSLPSALYSRHQLQSWHAVATALGDASL